MQQHIISQRLNPGGNLAGASVPPPNLQMRMYCPPQAMAPGPGFLPARPPPGMSYPPGFQHHPAPPIPSVQQQQSSGNVQTRHGLQHNIAGQRPSPPPSVPQYPWASAGGFIQAAPGPLRLAQYPQTLCTPAEQGQYHQVLSVAQGQGKIKPCPGPSRAVLPGQTDPVRVTEDKTVSSSDAASYSISSKPSQEPTVSEPLRTVFDAVIRAKTVSGERKLVNDNSNQSNSSSPALSNDDGKSTDSTNPQLQKVTGRLSLKRSSTSSGSELQDASGNDADVWISSKDTCNTSVASQDVFSKRRESTSSETASSLNPDVKEFVPKSTSNLQNNSHSKTENSENGGCQSGSTQEPTNSGTVKWLEPVLPPKPLLLRQRAACRMQTTTRESGTQTDSVTESDGRNLCAACQQRIAGDSSSSSGVVFYGPEYPISTKIKSISREHKVKYVACQAGAMTRDNPDCLSQGAGPKVKLKTRLQAMCRQFGSQVTEKSDWEDNMICQIALNLLKEQPDFAEKENASSYLHQLQLEVDVQLEIASELMAESPVKGKDSGLKRTSSSSSKNSSKREEEEAGAPSLNRVGHTSAALSSAGSTPTLDPETQIGLGKPGSEDPNWQGALPGPQSNLNMNSSGRTGAGLLPPPSGVTPDLSGLDPQVRQEAAELLKLRQVYMQNLLLMNMAASGAVAPVDASSVTGQKPLGSSLQNQNTASTGLLPEDCPYNDHPQAPPKGPAASGHQGETLANADSQRSNLTMENLLMHNSLIKQEEKRARARKTSGSDGASCFLDSAVGVTQEPHHTSGNSDTSADKKIYKFSALQKLPPLDLRPKKGTQKGVSLPPPLKFGRKSPALDTAVSPTDHANENLKCPTKGGAASSTQYSAPLSVSFSAQSSNVNSSNRKPLPAALAMASKPRKYLTPLQRKRLKMKGETELPVDKLETVQQCIVEGNKTEENHGCLEVPTAVSVAEAPHKKRASSPSVASFACSRTPDTFSSTGMPVPDNFPASSVNQFQHIFPGSTTRPNLPRPPANLSMGVPASLSRDSGFPASFHDQTHYPVVASGDAIAPAAYNQPAMQTAHRTDVGAITSAFSNMTLSAARTGQPSFTLPPPGQISCPTVSFPDPSVHALSSKLDGSSLPSGEMPAAPGPNECIGINGGRISPASSGQAPVPSEGTGLTYEVTTVQPTDPEMDNRPGAPSDAMFRVQGLPASQPLDDLETIDDGDSFDQCNSDVDAISFKSCLETGSRCDDDNVWSSNTAKEKANVVSAASPGEDVDVDRLVKSKVSGCAHSEMSTTSDPGKGGYGLDEISLTDLQKKAKSKAIENSSEETPETRPVKLDEGWQKVGKPKKSSKKPDIDIDILRFRAKEKYHNLVTLILDVYRQLQREEAQEVLETVFTSTNQLSGLRQGQILAEVDLVVAEWYPDRAHKTVREGEGNTEQVAAAGDANINGAGSSVNTSTTLMSEPIKRSWSQGCLGLSTDRSPGRDGGFCGLDDVDDI